MTTLQRFEVTQLIDFGHNQSANVTHGRDFTHGIAMVTWNVLECIQQMMGRIEAVDLRKNELNSGSTGQERLDFLFQCSEPDSVHSGPCILGIWKDFALYFSSSDAQWEDLSNGVSMVVVALVVVEILLFECEAHLWVH